MTKNHVLILLAHQDDELFILPRLMQMVVNKIPIFCVYLTTPLSKLVSMREQESLAVLKNIGIPADNVYFLGKKLNIPDGNLPAYTLEAFMYLSQKVRYIGKISEIYCTLWEGGHQDHDICCCIAAALKQSCFPKALLYGFPLYQGEDLFGKFFWTNLAPRRFQENTIKHAHSFSMGWKTVVSMFYYRSQWKTFIGLGPFIIWHTLVCRKHQLVSLPKLSILITRPHKGLLLYERYHRTSFDIVIQSLSKLFKVLENAPLKNSVIGYKNFSDYRREKP